jgi:thioredoxin reductase
VPTDFNIPERIMVRQRDVAIIGAGPFGLSCAAHLSHRNVDHVIFGSPMTMWREHMPPGMCLKSDGFASTLYDPLQKLPLSRYCAEHGLPYADLGLPVPIETFIQYGIEFQKRLVPQLDPRSVNRVRRSGQGFVLELDDETEIAAKQVIVATGIDHYRHIPRELGDLPHELLTHSAEYGAVSRLAGKKVAIIGRGASAIDLAVLGHEAGAQVHLVARAPVIAFHPPPAARRGPRTRLRYPTSGMGPGWRNVFYWKAPGLFRFLPQDVREEQIRTWLGPAPGWFVRSRAEGKFPVHLGRNVAAADASRDGVTLKLRDADGNIDELSVDHVIAATGFKTDIARLPFLEEPLKQAIATFNGSPLLSENFESSVPGLFIVGAPAALTFGPVMRFAVGAGYAAGRLGRHLSKKSGKKGHYSSNQPLETSGIAAE